MDLKLPKGGQAMLEITSAPEPTKLAEVIPEAAKPEHIFYKERHTKYP